MARQSVKEYPYSILKQGDWHISYVRIIRRTRHFLLLGIGTDEKRPDLSAASFDGKTLDFFIGAREGPMGFQEGQDGSNVTIFEVRMPWSSHGWTWVPITDNWDKYESRIAFYSQREGRA